MKRRAAVWAIVGIGVAWAIPASAFNFGGLDLDYLETFAGESAFPTTPETNDRGFGPMFPSFLGNGGLPGLPSIINQRVRFQSAGVAGPEGSQAQAIALNATALGMTTNVAVKGTFDALSLTNVGPGIELVSVGIGFDANGQISTPDVALGASLNRIQLPILDAWVFEVDVLDDQGNLQSLFFQQLPAAMQTAIASGASFDLILRFDRQTRQVSAALVAAGQEFASTPASVPQTQLPITAVSAAAQVFNVDPFGASLGANDSLRVDLRRFEVHAGTAPPAVPALNGFTVTTLALALLALAALSIRRTGLGSGHPRQTRSCRAS